LTLHFDAPQSTAPRVPGALSVSGAGKEWTVIANGARAEIPFSVASMGAAIVDEQGPTLSEIFVAHAGVSLQGDEPVSTP
jgi:hypothetical protein